MRNIIVVIFILISFVLSCKTKNTVTNSISLSDSLKYKILPSRFLGDSNIQQIAKDLYLEKIKPNDSEECLELLDKLGIDGVEKGFYFLVITKTMKYSDGAYSEPLGIAAKEYVEENPISFFSYFRYNKDLLQESDFKNWAEFVYGEIQINSEGSEKEAIRELGVLMKSKCSGYPIYIAEIDRFLQYMK